MSAPPEPTTHLTRDAHGWRAEVHTERASYVTHACTREDAEQWIAGVLREVAEAAHAR